MENGLGGNQKVPRAKENFLGTGGIRQPAVNVLRRERRIWNHRGEPPVKTIQGQRATSNRSSALATLDVVLIPPPPCQI